MGSPLLLEQVILRKELAMGYEHSVFDHTEALVGFGIQTTLLLHQVTPVEVIWHLDALMP
jgi:hypothetical protein